jgi:hypothetical protein
MPRKDPITGCDVMTMGEFFADTAKKEGIAPHEVIEDLFKAIDEADAQSAELLKQDHATFLKEVTDWIVSFNEDADVKLPLPVRVDTIFFAKCHSKLNGGSSRIMGTIEFDDHSFKICDLSQCSWHGSFYEPPDFDVNLELYPIGGENI